MTKEEWDSITDWSLLLKWAGRREYPERRFLLLAVAFLFRVQPQLRSHHTRTLDAIEKYAEGLMTRYKFRESIHIPGPPGCTADVFRVFDDMLTRRVAATACELSADPAAEYLAQAVLFRDIFGFPFRPVAFDPAWRSETAVALARGMYDGRDFGLMPVLADALDDAGCDHPDVLAHCRDRDGVHVRGCWVVDGVLGLA